ncbi:hypothetical protein [Natronospira bacteriovora]|uniref:Uncharacterized protein n=1 Tax=Natronospira bacteriovora TaxID=3069753 RepID=A0ABU0W716_9GAMM|nr:hypothetical protein [Natronospira sp. AB-CW4]MDQ2069819.1 hypothetical protein [Natronospira sp. AB-CW4]
MLWLVRALDQALTPGISAVSNGIPFPIGHPLCLFVGLHILLAAISSNARTMLLLEGMRSQVGCPNVTMPDKHGRPFEEWGIQDRANLILLAGWLLRDWPARFIASCQAADVMGSSFRRYHWKSELPFWFEIALKEGVDRPWYRVTAAEVDAARAYLLRRWLNPSDLALRTLVGHTVSKPRK